MQDEFIKLGFERVFNVEKLITIFYMELSKDFRYDGERHDFWEMVYIDKGEMVCTAEHNRFVLKSGEMTFHKPNEFHNLSGDNRTHPNVSIITFECKSRAMKFFEGKIFRLSQEERLLLSELFSEGLSCFQLENPHDPLLQRMHRLSNAPFGGSQMTKNLLENFLIKLCRGSDAFPKKARRSFLIDGVDVPKSVKEILDILEGGVYGRLTVADVARAVGKSESSVKQLFSRYFSGGIIKHYNSLKMREAKRLIREGTCNMTQIAEQLCFDSPQYFSKCFKAFTGMTPCEYKKSIVKRDS